MFSVDFTLRNFEYFLLILVRISMFVVVAPFFNTRNTPGRVKVGFSAIVSFMLFFVVDLGTLNYQSVLGYASLVLREAITGLMIGFAAYVCQTIILYAGTLIDMDIGISMAQEFDPTFGTQVSITGNLYNYAILLLLIVSDMHRYIFRAICDSFVLIPVGGTIFRTDSLLLTMTAFLGKLFVLAFRIMLPVFAVIMVLNCVLGIMAKVSPQMNMFAIGMQIKILVGFAVLFLTVMLLPQIADMVFSEMRDMMIKIIEGLS